MHQDLPTQFESFSQARKNGFLRVKSIKEQGGKIAGIFCTFTPLEILDAAGIVPVSLCGMSNETVPDAETHLPKNLCPLIKSSYGFAVSDKCPYTYFSDIIVGESTCDGKKKMYELLGQRKDTYILHLPQGVDYPYALDMWTQELHRFIEYLQQKFNISITDDQLRAAARARNEERALRCGLMEMQKQTPPPMMGYPLYKTLEGAGFRFSHKEIMQSLQQLKHDIKAEYQPENAPTRGKKRILITGCPIGGVLDKTVGQIEASGGIVVCYENCSGYKAAFQMVDDQADDIVRAIAARYLEIGCSVMTPNTRRMELLPQLIEDFQADGIVEVVLQACHTFNIEAYNIRAMAKEHNIPYLNIETDYSTADQGQLQTRIEAFLELL